MRRHAVLTDTHIIWISENERRLTGCKYPIHPQHVSELWVMGKDLGVTHFWVMPGTPIDGMGYSFFTEKEEYDIFVSMGDKDGEQKPKYPRSARCTKDNVEIKIGYPFREPFGWTCNHPLDVLAAIDYLQQLLPLTVQWSPQSMGERLLRDQYRATNRLQSYVADSTVDLGEMPFRKAAPDILFMQQWTPDMIGKYAHWFDKNAAHPTAAGMVTTGTGDPVHMVGCPEGPFKSGIYKVRFSSKGSPFDGVQLPKIIESEWITADVLRYAMKHGYQVDVMECYTFEHGYRLFEKWAPTLWDARQALKNKQRFPYEQGRENAYWTVKDIANRTISSLRKNWWADMVGQSRTAKLANLASWAGMGHYPQVVYFDDMCFLSDDEAPEHAIPGILARQDKPGGYKHKCSVLLTSEMIQDLMQFNGKEHKHAASKALIYLKHHARLKGVVNGR